MRYALRAMGTRPAAPIREAIFTGRLHPGDRLPPERQLAATFAASPVVVREAVHVLEAAGLLGVRHGATGGVFVADFSHRPMTESLSTLLRLGKATLGQITEARLALEPEVAALAARRRRREHLAPLEENLEATGSRLTTIREARLLNLGYHKLLVDITGNPFFTVCLSSLIDNLEGNTFYMDVNMGTVTTTLDHHHAVYDAVRRGRAGAAAARMREHIQHIQQQLERRERRAARGR